MVHVSFGLASAAKAVRLRSESLREVLDLPVPDPARADTADNAYVFERRIVFRHGDGERRARGAVRVADGHGEGVGRVVRTGNGGQPEQELHHLPDLLLLGASVANHRAFDLRR